LYLSLGFKAEAYKDMMYVYTKLKPENIFVDYIMLARLFRRCGDIVNSMGAILSFLRALESSLPYMVFKDKYCDIDHGGRHHTINIVLAMDSIYSLIDEDMVSLCEDKRLKEAIEEVLKITSVMAQWLSKYAKGYSQDITLGPSINQLTESGC